MVKLDYVCDKTGFTFCRGGGSDMSIRCRDIWMCAKEMYDVKLYYRTENINYCDFPIYVNFNNLGYIKVSNKSELDNISNIKANILNSITDRHYIDCTFNELSEKMKNHILRDRTIIDASYITDKYGDCVGYWIKRII
jgi:hypothetical protein